MKNRTVTITVAASFDDVFSYLSDPRTLPEWAYSFCESFSRNRGGWEVIRPDGSRLVFAIESDRASGCIEMLAGPTFEEMETFPVRIMKADNGETAISFTLFKSQQPGTTDAMFEACFRELVREAEGLVARFGGGEISRGISEKPKLAVGIVTRDLARSRDFYVENLGFRAVFDGPMYVQLLREESGDQIGLMALSDAESFEELTVPASGNGIWLNLNVSNVDFEYSRLAEKGVPFREGPKLQLWGDRTAVLNDPNGIVIFLSEPTGKMDASLSSYVVEDEELTGV